VSETVEREYCELGPVCPLCKEQWISIRWYFGDPLTGLPKAEVWVPPRDTT
jgi:hypothetical protein